MDSTINANFFEQTAKYYDTASKIYNLDHLNPIDIGGNLYQNAQTIAGVNQAMTAVDQGMLPWEVFNGIFAGVGGPFAVENRPIQKASPEVGGSGKPEYGPVYSHGYLYADRVRARGVQDPVSHNFPYSMDDAILATPPIPKANGYNIFQMPGNMNGKGGVYEIGVNKNGVIDHRFFRPDK
jgi:hypothetical protein